MKVLIVSAHFPPNFVSGGTLVPKGLAAGLRQRGHEVHVFAGWRGEGRAPLDQWDETDPDGVRIRWINSTPWLSDLDDRQFDNPEIGAAFSDYCDEIGPSVVNFHSLQGLGVGTVEVAAARRVPTVLTMHDFWWWCARMFMSDRTDRPCCPVVDCGVCECSAGSAWLARRNKRVLQSLVLVDRVVSVSEILARVAIANGVDVNRLVTIENGLPSFPKSAVEEPQDRRAELEPTGVRFVYAGGPDPRKGPYMLAEALRQIEELPGWSLTAYGWPEDLQHTAGKQVLIRPPFLPEEVRAVLGESDVLVIPSIMRESFSILARQALTHGTPVLTTDCLGPEEVVIDGTNGLVVPSADPVALGEAMRRIVTLPQLQRALKDGALTAFSRTMKDCVNDYEKLFDEVAYSDPSPASNRRDDTIKRVLFVVGITGAPLRYRSYLPAEALAVRGVESNVRHYRHPEVDRLASAADVVVLYRVPATLQVINLIAGLRSRGTPVVFDVDDLIFDPEIREEIPAVSILPPVEAEQWMEGVRRYRATLDLCDAFIGSTNPLAAHAAELTGIPSSRFANGVGRLMGQVSDAEHRRPRTPGPLRIGYLSGTNTHDRDWQHVEPAVARLLDEHPSLELWLIGHIEPTSALSRHASRVARRPTVHWTELPAVLRDLDVNLAPLAPGGRFNQAKSAVKWLEAALVGTPSVASPTEPFREVITHGRNGMLAETEHEWCEALDFLLRNSTDRKACGERARRDALLDLAPAVQAERYLQILDSVRSHPIPPSRTETWRAIYDDEPSAPFELDSYSLHQPEASEIPSRPITLQRRIADTRVTLREQGVAAAAARASRYGVSLIKGRLLGSKR